MEATHGTVVAIDYTLTDDAGEIIDKSDEPLHYLHGYDNIIPGLESGLEGAQPGDHRVVVVEPADGYGDIDPEALREVPKDVIPEGMILEPGMEIVAETEHGAIPLTVAEVRDDCVVLDANHPLAGKRLHFDVTVADVRQASTEELTEGCPLGM